MCALRTICSAGLYAESASQPDFRVIFSYCNFPSSLYGQLEQSVELSSFCPSFCLLSFIAIPDIISTCRKEADSMNCHTRHSQHCWSTYLASPLGLWLLGLWCQAFTKPSTYSTSDRLVCPLSISTPGGVLCHLPFASCPCALRSTLDTSVSVQQQYSSGQKVASHKRSM